MLRAYATQKSVVCGVLALLWIWFLWVYIAQPAGVSISPQLLVVCRKTDEDMHRWRDTLISTS